MPNFKHHERTLTTLCQHLHRKAYHFHVTLLDGRKIKYVRIAERGQKSLLLNDKNGECEAITYAEIVEIRYTSNRVAFTREGRG